MRLSFQKKRAKKKRDTAWCNGCPAAPRSMNDNWMHIDLTSLNCVATRSNCQESLQSRTGSSMHVNLETRFSQKVNFWRKFQWFFFWTKPPSLFFFSFKVFHPFRSPKKILKKSSWGLYREQIFWLEKFKKRMKTKTEKEKKKKRQTQQAQETKRTIEKYQRVSAKKKKRFSKNQEEIKVVVLFFQETIFSFKTGNFQMKKITRKRRQKPTFFWKAEEKDIFQKTKRIP